MLQILNRQLQLLRHMVERARQLANLVGGAYRHLRGIFSLPDRVGGLLQLAERLRNLREQEQREERRQREAGYGGIDEQLLNVIRMREVAVNVRQQIYAQRRHDEGDEADDGHP